MSVVLLLVKLLVVEDVVLVTVVDVDLVWVADVELLVSVRVYVFVWLDVDLVEVVENVAVVVWVRLL